MHHPTLGLRVIKKRKTKEEENLDPGKGGASVFEESFERVSSRAFLSKKLKFRKEDVRLPEK